MDEIRKIINEIIIGNDTNFFRLRDLVRDFFKEKTQVEIDEMDPGFVASIRESYGVIFKEESLTEIDRALLDYYFNAKMIKYAYLDISMPIDDDRVRNLVEIISLEGVFEPEDVEMFKNDVEKKYDLNGFYEEFLVNAQEDLKLDMVFTEYEESILRLFAVGSKKYEGFFKKILDISN